jgi:uncharacterized protein with PIN domain
MTERLPCDVDTSAIVALLSRSAKGRFARCAIDNAHLKMSAATIVEVGALLTSGWRPRLSP